MPVPRLPKASENLASAVYSRSIWVGLFWGSQILQAGIFLRGTKATDGNTTFDYVPFYGWLPDLAVGFGNENLVVVPGDEIQIMVRYTSLTCGSVILSNLSTGQVYRKDLTFGFGQRSLVESKVVFIVEAYLAGNDGHDLIDFGTVNFTHCESMQALPLFLSWSNL